MTTNLDPRTRERGFTITEILVASSIFAVIMIAALMIYDRSNKVFKLGVEAADVQQNTRIAFDKLVADLRMTGFDFDRDGIPSSTGGVTSFQQPDEQIEYIANTAITIRGNFDYNENPSADENGREWDLTSTAGPGKSGLESDQFPVVTTGNDEIVTYALVSNDSTKNTNSITFYADVPDRKAHPATGGRTENLVTISGVDLSNANPPYTLQRITLPNSTSSLTPVSRFPIATNIRSLTFEYFEDQAGTVALKDLANAVIAPADYASSVGGLGQFDPNAVSAVAERAIRGKIQSVKMVLVGMNEAPDPTYTDTADTIAPNFRKYRLETLVVPRNTGRRGMREQEFTGPNSPSITKVCIGYCGVAFVQWDAPAGGGAVEDYKISWDTVSTGSYSSFVQVGVTTQYFVDGLDPLEEYYFKVTAINSFDSAPSNQYPASGSGLSVKNATKPDPPLDADITVSGGSNAGDPPIAPNHIDLQWEAPNNATGTITCSPSGSIPPEIPIAEFKGWRVKRSLNTGFNPNTEGQAVLTEASAFPPDPITRIVNFRDAKPDSAFPPANCFDYYYRIRTQEVCNTSASNTSGNATDGNSAWTGEFMGRAESNATPGQVTDLSFDAASACSAGTCNIILSWPKVGIDLNGDSMFAGRYLVDRVRLDASTLTEIDRVEDIVVDLTSTNADFHTDPLRVTWTDPGGDDDLVTTTLIHPAPLPESDGGTTYYIYEYDVQAQQCASTAGAENPTPRRFPCAFTDPVTVALSETPIEGDGLSLGSAWLVDNSVSVTIDTGGVTMGGFEATLYIGGTPTSLGTVGSGASATFGIPDVADGVPVTVEFAITNLAGCRKIETRYFEQTASNCCLTPLSIDSTVAVVGAQEVRIALKNTCSENLTLNSVDVEWDDTKISNGAKLSTMQFPSAAGTCPTLSTNVNDTSGVASNIAIPSGTGVIPAGSGSSGIACGTAGSDEYRTIVTFSKGFTTTDATGPITQVCIKYTRPSTGATVTQCQIIPGPSATAGVCD